VPSQIINPPPWPNALYLHVPFCPSHCHYCDFAVVVGTDDLQATYVDYLLREIALTPTQGQPLNTVYIGGGTPSLLSPRQLETIIAALEDHFGSLTGSEITLECNPGTVTPSRLTAFRSTGINRISLGVQAFQDSILRQLGRVHSVQDIYEAVKGIETAGFTNFSLDLMFGLPNQTLPQWHESLRCALSLQPSHLSAYDLILEASTPFGRRYQPGMTPLPTEELTVQMYLDLMAMFQTAGYEHYEIATLARPGKQSRHNRVYWHNQGYYGLGVGATGYVWGERVTRPKQLANYFAWVEQGVFTRTPPVTAQEELSETLMLGLRLVEGIEIQALTSQFGEEALITTRQALAKSIDQGLLLEQQGRWQLSYPQGFLLANEVLVAVV
jgi:putative oxygen-independent coproporphyrinogen III oxidase